MVFHRNIKIVTHNETICIKSHVPNCLCGTRTASRLKPGSITDFNESLIKIDKISMISHQNQLKLMLL